MQRRVRWWIVSGRRWRKSWGSSRRGVKESLTERRLLRGREQQLCRNAAMNRLCMLRVDAGCDYVRLTAIERLGLKSLASNQAHIRRSFHCRLEPNARNL